MRQKELVGKKVLVKLSALPREKQEQRVDEPVFDGFSIVEVIGYNTDGVIIDGRDLGWPATALDDTDSVTRNVETYWYVNLNAVVTVLE